MIINYYLISKNSIVIFFISLSIIFFYSGYKSLKETNKKIFLEKTSQVIDKQDSKVSDKTETEIDKVDKLNIPEKKTTIIVKKNDTFSGLMKNYITDKKIKQQIIKLINEQFDLRTLKIGQEIHLYYSNLESQNEISKIVIPLNFSTDIVVTKNEDSNYTIKKEKLSIINELVAKQFNIYTSLYEDGRKANVPLAILSNIIMLYSFDIDFQRDIQKEDKLEVLYETIINEERRTVSYGKIKYVNLKLQKNNFEYFIFKTSEGFFEYFNSEGKNVKKSLMKTPLDGARISSVYGMRKHPILGYNKLHLGVDFAAPSGTPVYAAGNGVIDYAGRNGGYGKYVRIRHNNSYKTSYAHLNGFKKGISKGVRVNQGQVIGYVGSTGSSTGPHLHYEVIYKKKKINPMKMKLPSGKILKGKELEAFEKQSEIIYTDLLFHLYE